MPSSSLAALCLTQGNRVFGFHRFSEQKTGTFAFRNVAAGIANLMAIVFCLLGGAATASAQSGIASVYAYSTTRTASGARASPSSLTAAHRSLPFGTLVRVTNKRNGRSVVVRINDRGPFARGRVIDVTPAAAHILGFSGLAPVTLQVVGQAGDKRPL
jgi:rare lipoprotein A